MANAQSHQQMMLQQAAHEHHNSIGRNTGQGQAILQSQPIYHQSQHMQQQMAALMSPQSVAQPHPSMNFMSPQMMPAAPKGGHAAMELVGSPGKQGGSIMSNKKGSQSHPPNNNGSQLGDSDSKLGRKGERPTVAQILEIGVSSTGQNWMDNDGVP